MNNVEVYLKIFFKSNIKHTNVGYVTKVLAKIVISKNTSNVFMNKITNVIFRS